MEHLQWRQPLSPEVLLHAHGVLEHANGAGYPDNIDNMIPRHLGDHTSQAHKFTASQPTDLT
jgi:hypothetical protein